MTLLYGLYDFYEWVRNGLPHFTFGAVAFYCGIVVAISGGIEKVTGKKYIFAWVWAGLIRFFTYPSKLRKDQQYIVTEMGKMSKEIIDLSQKITYETNLNGGGSTKDELRSIRILAENTNETVRDLKIHIRLNEEIDTQMLFQLDVEGAWIWANRAFYNHFGFKETDCRAFNYENWIDKKNLQEVQIHIQRAIQTKSDFKQKFGIIDSDGDVHECNVQGVAILDGPLLKGFKFVITSLEKK